MLVTSSSVDDNQGNDARVIIGGAAVTLPGTISLTPATATNPVGTSHTVTASVRNPDGSPRSGVLVTFKVTSGPDNGRTGTGTTNAAGTATFTYTNTGGAGTDNISASYTENQNSFSATATKTWQGTGTPPTTVHSTHGTGKVRANPASRVYCFSFGARKSGSTLSGSAWVGSGRRQFVGHRVTSMTVNGDVAVFKVAGKYKGRSGYTLKVTATDGSPDKASLVLKKGSTRIFGVSGKVFRGSLTVS